MSLTELRADNPITYQLRSTTVRNTAPELAYAISTLFAVGEDKLGLFERLDEDGAFGCYVLEIEPGFLVSRDLLDSVLEINYLYNRFGLAFLKTQ